MPLPALRHFDLDIVGRDAGVPGDADQGAFGDLIVCGLLVVGVANDYFLGDPAYPLNTWAAFSAAIFSE
jgi:hypothetical protein